MNLEVPATKGGTEASRKQAQSGSKANAKSSGAVGDSRPRTTEANKSVLPAKSETIEHPALNTPPSVPLAVGETDLTVLRTKRLLIPVKGVAAGELRDSFNDPRSGGRVHHALDIMAAEGTPVLAAADGRLKLHTSALGGIMLYQVDPSEKYVYHYAHLQRYADEVYEGQVVTRGEVIGYVGDTGNAGAGNFHLHFGIARVAAPGKWSGGEPINPYLLLAVD